MDLKNQNMFGNQVFQKQVNFNQNPSLSRTVSELKAMSVDPTKKNQVLSSLNRFQGQMSQRDYNEILSNVKSINESKTLDNNHALENRKTISEQDYQRTVDDLKRLEHEVRYK
ncbi:MAG: hypothetical protein HFH08_00960 [Bacilli bacterium]|nr:hypothetical protein [Bacilli bacterium]